MKMNLINIKNLRNYMDENIYEHGLETVMNWYEDLVNSFPDLQKELKVVGWFIIIINYKHLL